MLSLRGVAKTYALGSTEVPALKGIDLDIGPGEFTAIVGPSGSGKSTLLHILGCIEKPSAGAVSIDGRDVTMISFDDLAGLRRDRLGFIFQTFNLLPVLTAVENVEFSLLHSAIPKAERRRRALEALAGVGLEAKAAHKPAELSGGQRQRVAIARALVARPGAILADEPTANLDHKTGLEIIALMKEVNRKSGTTFIFSTHDAKVVAQAGRVVEIADGELRKG